MMHTEFTVDIDTKRTEEMPVGRILLKNLRYDMLSAMISCFQCRLRVEKKFFSQGTVLLLDSRLQYPQGINCKNMKATSRSK